MRPSWDRCRAAVALALLLGACADPSRSDDAAGDQGTAEADSSGGAEGTTSDDGTPAGPPIDLVAPELWVAAPQDDPMPEHRPSEVACDVGFGDDYGVFEVDTGACNYGVFDQPTLASAPAGRPVTVVFTHDDLVADAPAFGHVLVAVAGAIVVDAQVPIPKPYGLLQYEFTPSAEIPAGTTVTLHLHNHGSNNWRLVSVRSR